MAAKTILVLCASACVFKAISAQCIGAANNIAGAALAAEEIALSGNGLAYNAGLGAGPLVRQAGCVSAAGYGLNVAPTSGGSFAVTSSSPFAPTGVRVVSENAIEGPLSINGQLPFLGVIALEGALPTAGAGAINYGCGNGAIGIVSEGLAPAVAPAGPAAFSGYGAAGLGYPGLAGTRGLNGLSGLGAGLGAGLSAGLGCGARF